MKNKKNHLTTGERANRAVAYLMRLIISIIVIVALVTLPIFGYFIIKADHEITPEFKNRQWALPARVYARPLELYTGKELKPKEMLQELEWILYRSSKSLRQPGTFYFDQDNNRISVHTRPFTYSDGTEESQQVEVNFKNNRITSIKNRSTGEEIPLTRIEPLLIASIYPTHNEDRILLKREEIPPMLIDTLLAMEDRAYYQHFGINPKGIMRALVTNFKAGKNVQGGSTLTQQLIKNYFLTSEKTLERKIQEMFYAIVLDWRFDKDEILEAYVNEIYLSQDGDRAIHGFGLASEFFFGKPVNELSIGEIATLVAVIPSPSSYNPRRNPEIAIKRRNLIIDVLVEQNLLSEEDAIIVKAEPLKILENPPPAKTRFPAFIELVYKQLKEQYSADQLNSGGLRIFTTLDPIVQNYAEQSVMSTLSRIEKDRGLTPNILQGSIVIAKNNTGEIAAIVGDRNVRQAGFNRALNTNRPIGSLVKPFVYLRALEEPSRYSLATPLDDASPINLVISGKTWSPNNYDRRLHGWVPLITALAKSYNLPVIRVGMDIGVENVVDTLYRLGVNPIKYNIPAVPSSLLGSVDLPPIEVAQIYSTIANNGYYTPLRSIREVTDSDSKLLAQIEVDPIQAIEPAPNYLITEAMIDVVNQGTAGSLRNSLGKNIRVAAKTGTTNDYRDSWFAGFTGNYTAVSWVGRDDNKPIRRLTGTAGALPIWAGAMKNLHLESISQEKPANIIDVAVDLSTGLLPPRNNCPDTKIRTLPFIAGYQPTYASECFYLPESPESGGFIFE
ncbi:penicillin-binding protein 1B [Ignatzschineria cameli]|nr:penicillin-binding protein 1B [Ignatzschineria cameli]